MSNQDLENQEAGSNGKDMKIPSNSDQNSKPQQIELSRTANPPTNDVDVFNQGAEMTQPYPEVLNFLDSGGFQGFVTLLTIYALFGDDIRVMGFGKGADIVFDALNIICLIVFSFEILLQIIAKPGYNFSFFFWLDIISTISLLLDIQLFTVAVGLAGNSGGASNTASLARAGRASRVGTKAGRVVRLVRLIRIAKLYKSATKNKDDKAKQLLLARRKKKRVHPGSKDMGNMEEAGLLQFNPITNNNPAQIAPEMRIPDGDEEEEDDMQNLRESKVSKALSDLTTKKVIIVILLLMFIIPLFDLNYYYDPPKTMEYQTEIFANIAQSELSDLDMLQSIFNEIVLEHKSYETPIVYLKTPFKEISTFEADVFSELRDDDKEIGIYTIDYDVYVTNHPQTTMLKTIADLKEELDSNGSLNVLGILDKRTQNTTKALLSFLRTIYVCVVLTVGSLIFSKDANDLALRPIERMIEKVNKIAKNPTIAVELKLAKDTNNNNETVKIENAIIKIGMLLSLGFGDAGSEIIGSNISKGGDVDPMLPGKKKCAIYGFCDIRNFTDATEQLQEDVMLFVNNIAEIVHSIVDRYAGAANKNIGDAFLLVWKMKEEKYQIMDDGSVIWKDKNFIEILSDCALISFMKIQAKINREPKILAYRTDERLLKRMPGYKVKMGFGLHLGWGIEGAIGSNFKIDASYLSPNVNMASRLEAATKQYGVPLLISSVLQENFSEGLKFYTRQIDKVTVKGSKQPIGFYTIDMSCDYLPPSKDPAETYKDMTNDDLRMIQREKKKFIIDQVEQGHFSGAETIEENKDLALIMKSFSPEFNEQFKKGFQMYLDGNWGEAKQTLLQAGDIKPDDGPTKTLMEVMEQTNFKCPSDWKGYRELTEK